MAMQQHRNRLHAIRDIGYTADDELSLDDGVTYNDALSLNGALGHDGGQHQILQNYEYGLRLNQDQSHVAEPTRMQLLLEPLSPPRNGALNLPRNHFINFDQTYDPHRAIQSGFLSNARHQSQYPGFNQSLQQQKPQHGLSNPRLVPYGYIMEPGAAALSHQSYSDQENQFLMPTHYLPINRPLLRPNSYMFDAPNNDSQNPGYPPQRLQYPWPNGQILATGSFTPDRIYSQPTQYTSESYSSNASYYFITTNCRRGADFSYQQPNASSVMPIHPQPISGRPYQAHQDPMSQDYRMGSPVNYQNTRVISYTSDRALTSHRDPQSHVLQSQNALIFPRGPYECGNPYQAPQEQPSQSFPVQRSHYYADQQSHYNSHQHYADQQRHYNSHQESHYNLDQQNHYNLHQDNQYDSDQESYYNLDEQEYYNSHQENLYNLDRENHYNSDEQRHYSSHQDNLYNYNFHQHYHNYHDQPQPSLSDRYISPYPGIDPGAPHHLIPSHRPLNIHHAQPRSTQQNFTYPPTQNFSRQAWPAFQATGQDSRQRGQRSLSPRRQNPETYRLRSPHRR